VGGIAFSYFDESDVVRHQLVQRIVRAYDEHKTRLAEEQMSLSLENKTSNGNGKALPGAGQMHGENLQNASERLQELKREETSRSESGGAPQSRNQE